MAQFHHDRWRQALCAALAGTMLLAALVTRPALAQVPACQVTYTIVNQWATGFTADLLIRNNGAAVTSWTLGWNFGGNQLITNYWNSVVTQSGASVTASNAAWNGSIASGGTVNFGFQASYSGTNSVPASFTLNGVACNGGSLPTNTPTGTARPTNTPTATARPTNTPTGTVRPTNTPTGTVRPTNTPTATAHPTNTPVTQPTATPSTGSYTGNATYFDALGNPYGGCGLPQGQLGTPYFVALNVQDTPGDYATFLPRPISAANASKIGLFDNGRNCGRWIRVTLGDFCTGTNDGAPGQPFCRGGSGWVSDQYNGAVLDFIVADSCQDGNAWCRDDRYHVDIAKAGLTQFVKNGQPVGDLSTRWNNRQVHWQFIEAPNYQGDIQVGFMRGASVWWSAIAIGNLRNGLHAVEYYANGGWQRATMNSDMGQSYVIAPTTTGGRDFRVRAYDVNDQLINAGRIYTFSLPASCGSQCSADFTPISYSVE